MSTALDDLRPTWVEIDLRAFERNVDAVASRLPDGARLVPVLKADGYGHGAVELAKRCTHERVAMIATVLLEEAVELRRAGITRPLLVLGAMTERQFHIAMDERITPGIPGPEELAIACQAARDRDVSVHLKLDSGMGRMGVTPGELRDVIARIKATPRLTIEAIYTHFANAGDPNDPLTQQQLATFARMVVELREAGIAPALHHTSNSAATARGIVAPGDFVRVGLSLYGGEPLDVGTARLQPVMRWRTVIARLKDVPIGHAVGYGATWHAARPSRIATLLTGYADGYHRRLSNEAEVLVRGRRVPVVGRVSMDMITVDVTDIPDAADGDEVVLLGAQGEERITAEELAAKIGTISYEIFTSVSARVPRVYVDGDRTTTIRSRFIET
jgi:alanine racemase